MNSPYYIRPNQRLKRILAEAFYLLCALFVLFLVGVSFYLIFTPALPILVPVYESQKQTAPPVDRRGNYGRNL